MRIRKRCIKYGYKWPNYSIPVQFCIRYACIGKRVNPDYPMPDETRVEIEAYLNSLMRDVTGNSDQR